MENEKVEIENKIVEKFFDLADKFIKGYNENNRLKIHQENILREENKESFLEQVIVIFLLLTTIILLSFWGRLDNSITGVLIGIVIGCIIGKNSN